MGWLSKEVRLRGVKRSLTGCGDQHSCDVCFVITRKTSGVAPVARSDLEYLLSANIAHLAPKCNQLRCLLVRQNGNDLRQSYESCRVASARKTTY